MINKGRFTIPPGFATAGCLADDDEDFDALLAASSLGSEQSRAIQAQAPAAAREHARRVLNGEEKCAPIEGSTDDAVGGLVNGLARRQAADMAFLLLNGSSLTARDLVIKWNPRQEPFRHMVLSACATGVLPITQRLTLLEALCDHDALAGLRHDVYWTIINSTFDMMPSTPLVLRRCAEMAFEQIDVSALTLTCPALHEHWSASSMLTTDHAVPLLSLRAPLSASARRTAGPARPGTARQDLPLPRPRGSWLARAASAAVPVSAVTAYVVTASPGWLVSAALAGAVAVAVAVAESPRRRAVGAILRSRPPVGTPRRRIRRDRRGRTPAD